MSFSRDTARSAAQKAIYDVGKWGLGVLWVLYGSRFLSTVGRDRFGLPVGQAVAWGMVVALIVPFIGLFLFDWWRADQPNKTVTKADPGQAEPAPGIAQRDSDLELAAYFSQQCNEAITEIRDKVGRNVTSLPQLSAFCKTAGRWFGRNEYVAAKVRERFPVEVDEFLVYGDKFNVQIGNDQIENQANHLRELITAKVGRLRTLSKALSDDARNRNYGQMSVNIGR